MGRAPGPRADRPDRRLRDPDVGGPRRRRVVAEPADGHVLRHLPPFAPGHDAPEASLWWAFFGQGKRSVVAPPGSAARDELLATADVVITDVDPADGEPTPATTGRSSSPSARSASPVRAGTGRGRSSSPGRRRASPSRSASRTGRALRPATPVQFASHVTSLYASTRRCSRGGRSGERVAARSSTCRCRSAACRWRRRRAWRCSSTTGCAGPARATAAP